jgi:hypothetical protein
MRVAPLGRGPMSHHPHASGGLSDQYTGTRLLAQPLCALALGAKYRFIVAEIDVEAKWLVAELGGRAEDGDTVGGEIKTLG